MAGFNDANTQYLLRTNLWSRQIKELLLDELNAMKFVRIISDLKRKVCKQFRYMLETPESLFSYLGKMNKIGQSAGKEYNEYCNRFSVACGDNGRRRNLFNLPPEESNRTWNYKRAA